MLQFSLCCERDSTCVAYKRTENSAANIYPALRQHILCGTGWLV